MISKEDLRALEADGDSSPLKQQALSEYLAVLDAAPEVESAEDAARRLVGYVSTVTQIEEEQLGNVEDWERNATSIMRARDNIFLRQITEQEIKQ
jgi:hypothetical protein